METFIEWHTPQPLAFLFKSLLFREVELMETTDTPLVNLPVYFEASTIKMQQIATYLLRKMNIEKPVGKSY